MQSAVLIVACILASVPFGHSQVNESPFVGSAPNGTSGPCGVLCNDPQGCWGALNSIESACNRARGECSVSAPALDGAVSACLAADCACRGGKADPSGWCNYGGDNNTISITLPFCSRYHFKCDQAHGACLMKAYQDAKTTVEKTAASGNVCVSELQSCLSSDRFKIGKYCQVSKCAMQGGQCDPFNACQAPNPMPESCSAIGCTTSSYECMKVVQQQQQQDNGSGQDGKSKDPCGAVFESNAACMENIKANIFGAVSEGCARGRCECMGGVFNSEKWARRPPGFDVREEVYCTKAGGVGSCALAGHCQKTWMQCSRAHLAAFAANASECNKDPAWATCISSLQAQAVPEASVKQCLQNECMNPAKAKDDPAGAQFWWGQNYDVRTYEKCDDFKDSMQCDSVEAQGCAWFDDRCTGILANPSKEFAPFESLVGWECETASIEEKCHGVSAVYNAAQCASTCQSAAECSLKARGVCSSPEFMTAFQSMVAKDLTIMSEIAKCESDFGSCMKGVGENIKNAKCTDVRNCITGLMECQAGIFLKRGAAMLEAGPAVQQCMQSRSADVLTGWPAECKAALCSGVFPRFSQVPLGDDINAFLQRCSPNSVCDASAPAAKMVVVEIKIEMSSKLEGIAFSYFSSAPAAAQEAFKAKFIEDLYAAFNLDKSSVVITVTSVSAGSIAIDYVISQTVTTEEGAPPPSAPVLPSAGSPITLVSSKASLEQDLKVPAQVVSQVSALTTSDPVAVTVTLTDKPTPTPSSSTSTPTPLPSTKEPGGTTTTSSPGPVSTSSSQTEVPLAMSASDSVLGVFVLVAALLAGVLLH